MAKTKEYVRWSIIGENGLYVDQRLTRVDAIVKHVSDLYGVNGWSIGRGLTTEQLEAWNKCRANGDRAVKVRIIVPVSAAPVASEEL